jgi:hypothetical protein
VNVPKPSDLDGSWQATLLFLTRPHLSLLNQANPAFFRMTCARNGATVTAKCRMTASLNGRSMEFGQELEQVWNAAAREQRLRLTPDGSLLGTWPITDLPSPLLATLGEHVSAEPGRLSLYWVARRV